MPKHGSDWTPSDRRHITDQEHNAGQPLVAVVIPVYKQPEYLKDAVISAVRQTMIDSVRVVIVNDGCPFPSTERIGCFLQDAFPETVRYLRKPNGGPSSARNHGIRFALAAWPSIRAIFPLDDDNRLSPHTLETLWHELSRSPSDVGWIYQDFNVFGGEEEIWRVGVPFNLYRLVHENYCDAGSLIRREVFEAGIWYDERMRGGFEDWEFYINAGLSGFRGQHIADTGFLYRSRPHSRNMVAIRNRAELHEFILRKHQSRLRPVDLTRLEHQDMPRFAVVLVDKGTAFYATDVAAENQREMPVASYVDQVNKAMQEPWPKATYVPPITLCADSSVLDLLIGLRVLPGIMYALQRVMPRFDYVVVSLELANEPHRIELSAGRRSGELALFAVRTRKWVDLRDLFGKKALSLVRKLKLNVGEFTLQVGAAHLETAGPDRLLGRLLCIDQARLILNDPDTAARARNPFEPRLKSGDGQGRLQDEVVTLLRRIRTVATQNDQVEIGPAVRLTEPHGTLTDWWQAEIGKSSFPCRIRPVGEDVVNVLWAVPWLTLGGLDRCVLYLAAALARSRSDIRHHVVVTAANIVEVDPRLLRAFDTVTFLPDEEIQRKKMLEDVLLAADVVINAHSLAAYELLPELKARSRALWMSYLHVIDPDVHGRPGGYPVLATRQYGDLIDRFLVISRQLHSWCANMGIPGEKIHVLPNAPTVFPATRAEAIAIAAEKTERSYSVDDPLQILFSGRFDHQKGFDRLKRIAECLEKRGVPFSLTLLGKKVMNWPASHSTIPGARVLPATANPEELARRYREADVLLLPSRWEGVPLAILEAMAFGAIVVATNVGAVAEVVSDKTTGFLVDPALPEPDLITATCDVLAGIATFPGTVGQLRHDAVEAAMNLSWDHSATILSALIEPRVIAMHAAEAAAAAAARTNLQGNLGAAE